jgi:1,2-diacylglycerol 3-beta-glucosyltransferase
VDRGGLSISFEKLLLMGLILCIWASVLLMEKFMPHWSAAIPSLSIIMLYGVLISAAHFHHRRNLAKGKGLEPPPSTEYTPFVSIVVPAHNEAYVIADTVKNMLAIDYPHYDLWIFDDRSTDGTADVLAALTKEYPGRFHYVVRPETALPGKSAVLNDALERVEGEIILVFDADARVEPNFLTGAVPYLAEPGVGAVQVRKVIMNPQSNLLTRCQYHEYLLDAHFQTGRDIIRGAVELRGNGQLVKRVALESVGGWTEETITDDLDLSTKLHLAGWDVRFTNTVTVREEGILHFKPLLRQRRRWAEGSLKRYLEYGLQMLTSPHVSKRAMADMMAYLMEFLFPIWAATDCIVQLLNYLGGEWPSHLTSSLIVFPGLGIFFLSGLYVAIRQYDRANVGKSIVWAFETALFLMVLWVPVVMWITGKVLLTKDEGPLNWGKTEHLGTQVVVKASRLARLKNFIQRSENSSVT